MYGKKHSSPRGEWSSTPPEHDEHHEVLEGAAARGELDSQPEEHLEPPVDQFETVTGDEYLGWLGARCEEVYFMVNRAAVSSSEVSPLLPYVFHVAAEKRPSLVKGDGWGLHDQMRSVGLLSDDENALALWDVYETFQAFADLIEQNGVVPDDEAT